jgi:uncharacterized protein YkwD
MPLQEDGVMMIRQRHSSGVLGSLLIASGIALLVLSSALFLGQGPAAGSEEPLAPSSSTNAALNRDVIVLLAPDGPAFDTADARLLQVETAPVVPDVAAQPPLMVAGEPAAEPVVAPPPAAPQPAPVVVPVQPMPTSTPLPPAPTPTLAAPPPTEEPPPPPPPPAPVVQPVALSSFESDIAASINNERIAAGLAPLQLDAALVEVSRERSNDMIRQGYFGHVSPSGETAFSLLDRYGIPYGWAGENLARNNYPEDECVGVAVHDWMASEGHRENILNVHYTAMGVGAAVDGSGMYYFTMVFTGPG